jgi:hypothetical protein
MDIALTDDLQRLLRKRVEDGLFASEEAAIETALKVFLIEGPNEEHSQTRSVTEPEEGRLPGPFIADGAVCAPVDLPRSGQHVTCRFLHDVTRQPDIFPGE